MDKVSEGTPFSMKADDWNSLVDAASITLGGKQATPRSLAAELGNILKQNLQCEVSYSGGNLDEMSILTYPSTTTAPGIDPAVNPLEVLRTPCFAAVAPTATTDPVLITTEPNSSSAGGLIRCVYRGIAVCTVTINDITHKFATPTTLVSKLSSAATGQVRILYQPSGTGDKVCIVDILDNVDTPSGSAGGWFARLTTSSGGNWKYYVVGWTGSAWADVGSESAGFTAVPLKIDGTNLCNPLAGLRVWMIDSATAGYQEFMPIGYADKISSTYYPGLVSTGIQTWTGGKILDANLTINNLSGTALDANGDIVVVLAGSGHNGVTITNVTGSHTNPTFATQGGIFRVNASDGGTSLAAIEFPSTILGALTDAYFTIKNYSGGHAEFRAGEFGNETGHCALAVDYGLVCQGEIVARGGFAASGGTGVSAVLTTGGHTYTFSDGILVSVV